ncbi:hypothetical protein K7432_010217 [Basidiobolus ranarum]|uniref:Uncharacterized protein n=1 Tax=Basidiobolus ranarum TaxID=34480 RepID=A0ABR2VW01_9FUNG
MRHLFLLSFTLAQSLSISCQSSLEANAKLEASATKNGFTYILGGLLSVAVVILAAIYFAYRGWKNYLNRKESQRRIRLALNDHKLYPSTNNTELPPYSFRASQVTLPGVMVQAISEKTRTRFMTSSTCALEDQIEVIIDGSYCQQQRSIISPPPPVYNA